MYLRKIQSVSDIITTLAHMDHNIYTPKYCFRGEKQYYSNTRCIPKIFRTEFTFGLEKEIFNNFSLQSYHLLPPHLTSDLEKLVIGQHHGLITRLLDWTLNPLIALFFAIESLEHTDAYLYCLPVQEYLSSEKIQNMSFDNIYHDENGIFSKCQSPKLFYVRNICNRISSQKGLFTIHHNSNPSLGNKSSMQTIKIPANSKQQLKKELAACNISRATVYCTLDDLTSSINDGLLNTAMQTS